jgi:hypothetical protein
MRGPDCESRLKQVATDDEEESFATALPRLRAGLANLKALYDEETADLARFRERTDGLIANIAKHHTLGALADKEVENGDDVDSTSCTSTTAHIDRVLHATEEPTTNTGASIDTVILPTIKRMSSSHIFSPHI